MVRFAVMDRGCSLILPTPCLSGKKKNDHQTCLAPDHGLNLNWSPENDLFSQVFCIWIHQKGKKILFGIGEGGISTSILTSWISVIVFVTLEDWTNLLDGGGGSSRSQKICAWSWPQSHPAHVVNLDSRPGAGMEAHLRFRLCTQTCSLETYLPSLLLFPSFLSLCLYFIHLKYFYT